MIKKIKKFFNGNLESIESLFETNDIYRLEYTLKKDELKILISSFNKYKNAVIQTYYYPLPNFIKKYIINTHKTKILAIKEFALFCNKEFRSLYSNTPDYNKKVITKSIQIAKFYYSDIVKILDYASKIITKLNNVKHNIEKELYLYENKVKR